MNYEDRLKNLDEHLKKHPADYQAVIARLKIQSDAYEYERKKRVHERLKKVAYYRRMLDEKQ